MLERIELGNSILQIERDVNLVVALNSPPQIMNSLSIVE
jgi:hypothetical protein